jgi:transposase-like protein
MTARASLTQQRAIYDGDLPARIDAAMARTRRFITSTEAVRASVQSRCGTPFIPYCLSCQQSGRTHNSPLTSEQHYICAHCQRRWAVLPTTR